ncbi:MAG TPA: S9 family peptidase [Saprospiraceae bacterium]|nr:S9 family peptidase [Saprospiraceae bacterium]
MDLPEIEFLKLKSAESDSLNGYILRPQNMEEGREYPLLMYVYGGPGSQKVLDKMSRYYWWFQMLAQQGYVIACFDNRGTGGRSDKFQKQTYMALGQKETADQIAVAEQLGKLPYVDEERMGIFGWSYGGYLSTSCILKGAETFHLAIAVAPVTNWKWYDTIYTERYMRTERENPKGYQQNSPVHFAHLLEGKYMIVHGGGDDNVHPQHTHEMVRALVDENKHFEMLYYPNKNHSIYGGYTRWHLYEEISNFIADHL